MLRKWLALAFGIGVAAFVLYETMRSGNVTSAATTDEIARTDLPEGIPTFARDIAPIVYRSCTPCHHEQGSGPFPLVTYRDVEKRALQICMVTEERYMPPWKPLPGYGEFKDARGLSDAQIQLFEDWLLADTPFGDPDDLPPAPDYSGEWLLGEPDLVVGLEEDFVVPAEGRDIWTTLKIPTDFPDDVYIRAIEAHSNNQKVLHHFMMFLDTKGLANDFVNQSPIAGDGMVQGESLFGLELYSESVMSWLPGVSPYYFPEGSAVTLPAGASLILDTHFRTTGRPEEVSLDFGLHLADGPPDLFPGIIYLAGEAMNIPPGMPDYTIHKSFVTPVDVEASAFLAHAHYVCKIVEAYAVKPDGERVPLMGIDDWDFEWQDTYQYAEPIPLPAGTSIEVFFLYDNSADNPRNPFSPPRRVVTGLRTTDEMSITWLHVTVSSKEDLETLKREVHDNWNQVGLRSQRNTAVWNSLISTFDQDGDHTLDPAEEEAATRYVDGIWERPAHLLKAFDADGDGELDPAEHEYAKRMIGSWHGELGQGTKVPSVASR